MRILLVEDDRSLSRAVSTILQKNNYSVDCVENGQIALDYLEEDIYDAVIMDIMMPVMDGITALKNLRKRGSNIPVLMLTAKTEIDDKVDGLDAEGIFTHFAVSDEFGEEYESYTKHQFELFTSVIDEVEKKLGKKFKIRHCANTGAVARYPETWLDMVRPGLLLYGYGDFAQELGLKPVMSLKTTVSTIKTYPAGTAISYGGIYKTDRKTRMGVVPYGYADGYFRCLSNRYELMTEEGPAPQRGKICMDMCMIDLTDKMNVDVGSEVEIFGKANPIEHMAQLAGTIPYELTCAVSKRVPRMYIKDGKVYEKELLLRG